MVRINVEETVIFIIYTKYTRKSDNNSKIRRRTGRTLSIIVTHSRVLLPMLLTAVCSARLGPKNILSLI